MKHDITYTEAIDTIEAVGGKYPGYRRAHAKGVGFTGTFKPNGQAGIYTKAEHLKTESSEAIIRFSDASPNPDGVLSPFSVKGMSVQIVAQEKITTNLVMASIPVFVSKTPKDFVRLMQVAEKGKMNVKDKLKAMINKPEFHVLPKIIANFRTPKSYWHAQFYSIHAFILENELGERQPVKFIWEPVEGEDSLPILDVMSHTDAYLEKEMADRVREKPVQFKLMIQFGTKEDDLTDPTQYWSDKRIKLDIGTLTVEAQLEDDAESTLFDPTVVPEGIVLPDDPILHFRSGTYHEGYRRRTQEKEE